MAATQTASVANNVVALPRESTATLQMDDLLNYNPLIVREDLKKVLPYFKDFDILKALEISNKVQITKEISYRVYEEGQWFRPVTPLAITGNTSTGTTGGTVTMTLTTGSYSSRSNGITTGTSSLYTSLMKNDVFRTYNGLYGFVQDKSGSGTSTVFTIERAATNNSDLAAALNYHATQSIPLGVLYNAYAEGSLQPTEGLSRSNVFHTNNTHILKTHRSATGTANAMELITVRGAERPIETQKVEMSQEHRIKEANALIWGTGENWTDPTEPLRIVKTTKGLDGSIREMGNIYQYSTTVGYTEADFDAQLAQFETVRGGNEYMIYAGAAMYGYLQAIFKAKIAGLTQLYTFQSFGASDGKKKAIEVGFNSFEINGITFHLIRSDMFNVQGMTDILGYNYRYMAFWVPGEMQVVEGDFTQNGRESTKASIPAMSIVYTTQAKGNEMRRYKWWPRPVEITNRDEDQQEMLTEVGGKFSMVRKYAVTDGI